MNVHVSTICQLWLMILNDAVSASHGSALIMIYFSPAVCRVLLPWTFSTFAGFSACIFIIPKKCWVFFVYFWSSSLSSVGPRKIFDFFQVLTLWLWVLAKPWQLSSAVLLLPFKWKGGPLCIWIFRFQVGLFLLSKPVCLHTSFFTDWVLQSLNLTIYMQPWGVNSDGS